MPPLINPITGDCVACWRLDEPGASDAAIDATGNGHNGTANQAQPSAAGIFGTARELHNYGDSFIVTNHADLQLDVFTIVGWYKPSLSQSWASAPFIGKRYNSLIGYSWQIGERSNYSTAIGFRICMNHGGSGTYVVAYSSMELTRGRWYHVAATFDGTYAILYIDGQPHAKIKNETGITSIPYDHYTFRIGQFTNVAHYFTADDWAYYNTAKSHEWIYNQFAGSSRPADSAMFPVDATAVAIYGLNETVSGEAARDVTGNERHATAYGEPDPVSPGHWDDARDISADGFFETYDDPAWRVDEFTICAVVAPVQTIPSPSSGYRIFHKIRSRGAAGLISTGSWVLGLDSGNLRYPGLWIRLTTGVVLSAIDTNTIPHSDWSVLIGTYDGTWLRLYLNGVEVAATENTTGTSTILYTGEEVGFSATYEYRGMIDEFAFYNEAKDAAWVAWASAGAPDTPSRTTISHVFVVAQDVIKLIFTSDVAVTESLVSIASYSISAVGSGVDVDIKEILPVLGPTTTSILIRISRPTRDEMYSLTIAESTVFDRSGAELESESVLWVHSRTKTDSVIASMANMYDMLSRSNLRGIAEAITIIDEEIGGVQETVSSVEASIPISGPAEDDIPDTWGGGGMWGYSIWGS